MCFLCRFFWPLMVVSPRQERFNINTPLVSAKCRLSWQQSRTFMHSQALGHSTSNDAHSHTTFVLGRQRERLTDRHYGHTQSLVNSVTAMRLSLGCWYECQDQRYFIRNLGCDIRPVLFINQPMSSFSLVFCLFLFLAKMLSLIEHLQRSHVFISSWNGSGSLGSSLASPRHLLIFNTLPRWTWIDT